MPTPATTAQSLWVVCGAWLRRSEEVISASADALNTLNVFPVSDADTGSNLKLTLRGITQAVASADRTSLDPVVRAAVLSAHGNSGAILAEMVVSGCRFLEESSPGLGGLDALGVGLPGAGLAELLRRVAIGARQAVARPVAGTILTVADATADAAVAAAGSEPAVALAVALAAQQAAREALVRTTDQLEVLTRAGVVDAGAQAYALLVDVLVEVLGGPQAQPLADVVPPAVGRLVEHPAAPSAVEYEVMYALHGASRDDLDALRGRLSELGHSVVIVGDTRVAQVHVHLELPGAAVEAGLAFGTPGQIRITALEAPQETLDRTVLSMVAGPGLAEAVRALGGLPFRGSGGQATVEELQSVLDGCRGEVVILPNDMEHLELAHHAAGRLGAAGRRIAVIPTVAQVQGLAAMAVHEPSADFDSAVVAMSNAAGHARQGAVTVAETSAMTMAGRCRPGDVLGLVEGDFVEIGTSVLEVAWRVVQRLLAVGGELLTLVAGVGADPDLLIELRRRALAAGDAVDVEQLDGGQSRYLLLIGLE